MTAMWCDACKQIKVPTLIATKIAKFAEEEEAGIDQYVLSCHRFSPRLSFCNISFGLAGKLPSSSPCWASLTPVRRQSCVA
jgi:hypothetical protein